MIGKWFCFKISSSHVKQRSNKKGSDYISFFLWDPHLFSIQSGSADADDDDVRTRIVWHDVSYIARSYTLKLYRIFLGSFLWRDIIRTASVGLQNGRPWRKACVHCARYSRFPFFRFLEESFKVCSLSFCANPLLMLLLAARRGFCFKISGWHAHSSHAAQLIILGACRRADDVTRAVDGDVRSDGLLKTWSGNTWSRDNSVLSSSSSTTT